MISRSSDTVRTVRVSGRRELADKTKETMIKKLLLVSFVIACAGPAALLAQGAKGPDEVLLAFQKCLQTGAYSDAADSLSADSIPLASASGNTPAEWIKKEMADDFFKKFEIVSLDRDGDWVAARLKVPAQNTRGTLYLVREGGIWKISLFPRERLQEMRAMAKEGAEAAAK